MITKDMTRELIGQQAFDAQGEKVGKIGQVYLDERSGDPTWATVNTGLFGTGESFVPLQNAGMSGKGVELGVDKQAVKDCPHVGRSDERLSSTDESELYRHYGIGRGTGEAAQGRDTATTTPGGDARHATAGYDRGTATTPGGDTRQAAGDHDRSGRTASGEEGMVRHEEQLRVGTQTEEAGRVALRKYVVTEEQTVTVPVSHEEVRLQREPIEPGTEAAKPRESAIGEETHEVTLHRERPVVDKTTEAVEKVRLDTRTVTEDQAVSDTIRKERVEIDDPSKALPRDEHKG